MLRGVRLILQAMMLVAFSTLPAAAVDGLSRYVPPGDVDPQASFEWSDASGSRTVTIAEVEALPMVRMVTGTGWAETAKTFEGVLLSDVLAHLGAPDASSITVRAVDSYSATIPREHWLEYPILLATRSDGRPLTRRDRGPARIIYPVTLVPALSDTEYANRSVWLITEIERH
jgi:hypothetical protein